MSEIEVRDLTKRFGGTTAVDGLTFTVRAGAVTGFLGPNGAGKTTTMRMMLGLAGPTSGTVTVAGHRYADLPDPMRTVGALLDAGAVHGRRTAYHHLLCLAQAGRIPKRRVAEVLGAVGLADVAGRRAGTFSLGMSQRLGIAAALLGDPAVLLFDEPVNGLDPEGIRWVRTLMRRLAAEGRTVLVSSHLMSEMALTADHLVVIGRGRLIADTSVANFIAGVSEHVVRVRSPQAPRLRDLLAGHDVTVAGADTLEVAGTNATAVGDVACRNGIPLTELVEVRPSLEDAFMTLTGAAVEFTGAEGAVR
ncbi:MAG TPA: ABC transporter ATP-binding protein [Pseudonocardiaceae bacterium]|nr:ABC transporter ATP-binding protein [Pseudonocardiaceae bacterium]